MHAGKALAEARQAFQRGLHRRRGDAPLRIEACAEAQRFAPRVLPIDLVALDPADFEPEAVGSKIDDSERGRGHDIA